MVISENIPRRETYDGKFLYGILYSPYFSDFLKYKKSLSFSNLNLGDYKLLSLESLKGKW